MARYLLNVVETYRVDSEDEAEALISEAKADGSFELTKYNCERKEKKAKGEVIDEAVVCKLTKQYYANMWELE